MTAASEGRIGSSSGRKFDHRNVITVIEKYYFRSGDGQPYAVDHRYTKGLTCSDEVQVYHRRTSANELMSPIDHGWFDPQKIGMMIVINGAGSFPQKVPTDKEREEEAKKILQITTASGTSICNIFPGESLKMQPVDLSLFRIKSLYGTVKLTIYLFPK